MDTPKKAVDEFYSVFADTRCVVGEGPVWVEEENSFYWLDLVEGKIYRKINVASAQVECFELNIGKVGGMVQTRSGDFLVFAQYGVVYRWKPNCKLEKFAELPDAKNSRFNDIAVAPNGDVFCGVAPEAGQLGSLWRFDSSKKFSLLEADIAGMPNGMGFSPDNSIFYFTISDERAIYKYDYCNGSIKNKTPFAKLSASISGVPDGMAVDAQGNVWSANWNGYSLSKYAPSGKEMATFYFPIKKITSLAFGGENLSKVLITTANNPWLEDDYNKFSSGKTLEMTTAISGLARFKANF